MVRLPRSLSASQSAHAGPPPRPPRPPSPLFGLSTGASPQVSPSKQSSSMATPSRVPVPSNHDHRQRQDHSLSSHNTHGQHDHGKTGGSHDNNGHDSEEHTALLRFASHLLPPPANAPPALPPLLPLGSIATVTTRGTGTTLGGGSSFGVGCIASQGIPTTVNGNTTSGNETGRLGTTNHSPSIGTDDGLALDRDSATALFSHAVLLFHAYCWHQSLKLHRSILRRGFAFRDSGDDSPLGRSGGDTVPPAADLADSGMAKPDSDSYILPATRYSRGSPQRLQTTGYRTSTASHKKIPLPRISRLWFNIGIIRCHLGEYALAVEALDRAVEEEKKLAVAWFVMGMALFELYDFRRAERRFKMALLCFDQAEGSTSNLGGDGHAGGAARESNSAEGNGKRRSRKPKAMQLDYRSQGLDFVLERSRVEFNVHLSMLWKLHRQVNADQPPPWSLNRLPAGKMFEPVDHSSNDRDCSGFAVGKIDSLSEMEEKKAAPESPRKPVVRFAAQQSAPAPPRPPMTRAESSPQGKSLPARLPRRFFPMLRRHKTDTEGQSSTTSKAIIGKSDDNDKKASRGSASSSSPTKSILKGKTTGARPAEDAAIRHERTDSFAMFASSTYNDHGAFNQPTHELGRVRKGSEPGKWDDKPLPPLPLAHTAQLSTSLPEPSPLTDTVEPHLSRPQPSPEPTDSFIRARRESAFARLNIPRTPGPAKVPDMRSLLDVLQGTLKGNDDGADNERDGAPISRITNQARETGTGGIKAATGTGSAAGLGSVGAVAAPKATLGDRGMKTQGSSHRAIGNSNEASKERGERVQLDSVQIFGLGRQQPNEPFPQLPAPLRPPIPPRPQRPPQPWP